MKTGLFALMMASLLLAGCHSGTERHDHSEEHPEGHDHHEENHGHGDGPMVSQTLWNDQFEMFSEHTASSAGEPVSFLIHLTVLDGFQALQEASVTLTLDGPATLSGTASEALRPGIFLVELVPQAAGHYRGRLDIEGSVSGSIEGISFDVNREAHKPGEDHDEDDHDGLIEFLKEQQWRVPFSTEFAHTQTLFDSVIVGGTITTPPGGKAVVGSPVTGRVVMPSGGMPYPGSQISKGQVLASLVPSPSSNEEAVGAQLAVTEAEARLAAAQTAYERAKRLLEDDAISLKASEEAKRELRVAEESLLTAKRSAELFTGTDEKGHAQAWLLTAPIDGTLVSVSVTPGATVSPGDTLFQIVDTNELWISARVPEHDAARLRADRDASFRITGQSKWRPLTISGADAQAELVMLGRVVDPQTRTVDIIYSLGNDDPSLRIGGLVEVSVPVGESFHGVAIPASSVIDQDGRGVVYIQVDGEHFEERSVRTGPRSGGLIGILDGLAEGERVVTVGAHLVRLADRANSAPAHGHIH